MNTLGICVGASSVSAVHLAFSAASQQPAGLGEGASIRPSVVDKKVQPHEGSPARALRHVLSSFDLSKIDRFAATGRRFRHFINFSTIPEPEAVELAYHYVKPADVFCPAVVSCGGETFMVYVLDDYGRIANVLTGNKCASGTGEFFLQQVKRMGVSLEEAASWSGTVKPYSVSGRCSVFCKSDCTHAVNKGVPKARVAAGLCLMMASKILELVKNIDRENIMLVGGCTRNRMMVEYLSGSLPNLHVPDSASCFESLGAALWAGGNEAEPFPGFSHLFTEGTVSFDPLPGLQKYQSMVEFKTMNQGQPAAGDTCILGLDVGSTTTKAILLRQADDAIVASVYLSTYGDPVAASRACYRSLLEQVEEATGGEGVSIIGLGVCGSGRQIAGLHALTDGVINEIIAHAAAAVYFDPRVDTLFEIGGQDAKYTYITNEVPTSYAMNEACSAGTGSFLAESAEEVLGVPLERIAEVAKRGDAPANFNDQCAAFIGSDIKRAIQEGAKHENIVGGLVYSICQNYINRVKGNRSVGDKIFMQGGVCYNQAVPLAMASVCGKPIIVPPEPGLMGAFGAALENRKRIQLGLLEPGDFDLSALAGREVNYKDSFVCRGGGTECERRCEIAVLELAGRSYPFGGACNRYYNQRNQIDYDVASLDLVKARERMVFTDFAPAPSAEAAEVKGRVGINRSFMTAAYYPFYAAFFRELGFEPVLATIEGTNGADQCNAAFCYPAELAHEYFSSLLRQEPPVDYIFLPQIRGIPRTDDNSESQTCPFVQAEPYYLATTYRKKLADLKSKGTVVLQPCLNMAEGIEEAERSMVDAARQMGIAPAPARKAFATAVARQRACFDKMQEMGQDVLDWLAEDPDQTAMVLFGRPYNAFMEAANMGIPNKLASRGVVTVPMDFLPFTEEPSKQHMYWGMGQRILQAARLVKKHPQLYPVYITNFSCGVDSFVVSYFSDIMGAKPYLTLELDSHTADAGIETRLEAFQDVVAAYRQSLLGRPGSGSGGDNSFVPAKTIIDKSGPRVVTSAGEVLSMRDSRVKFLTPSMGRLTTELMRSVFRQAGFHVVDHPPADDTVLKLGRAHTSCKECLPLILTTGKLLNYVYNKKEDQEVLVYFMPSASGPCRFGQYSVFMNDLINRLQLSDVTILSLDSNNFYYGLEGHIDYYKVWWSIVIADIMEDARSMILANARDVEEGLRIFEEHWQLLVEEMTGGSLKSIMRRLENTALALGSIPLRKPPGQVPKVMLTGEIFVRRDSFSRQYMTERLANRGIAVKCSPISEWIHYLHYNAQVNREDHRIAWLQKVKYFLRNRIMQRQEQKLEEVLAHSGLVNVDGLDIETVVENASAYISPKLSGEAILTTGSALAEVASDVAGVIVIGPFGCMPHRISESIMSEVMTSEDKLRVNPDDERLKEVLADIERLPFLAVEADGSPFPQLIEARLEAFCLQAWRLHEKMIRASGKSDQGRKIKGVDRVS